MVEIARKIVKIHLWGKYSALGLSVALLVFMADQLSKWFILHKLRLADGDSIKITDFFNLTLVWNRGVSYGLFQSNTQIFLIIISVAISLYLWRCVSRSHRPLIAVALGLVMGGALGNALDRYNYGAVVDFLHFFYHDWHWYVFNVADMAVVVGVGILLYESVIERHRPGLGNA